MFATNKTHRRGVPSAKSRKPKKDDSASVTNIKSSATSTPATSISINGIDIHFPFQPYNVQHQYMSSVITALQASQHALLESPTGTGKTLCLLCSALAWQIREKSRMSVELEGIQSQQEGKTDELAPGPDQSQDGSDEFSNHSVPRKKAPVIIYASRTHSQLSQVMGELRNTRYRPKHSILGSREHSCIHPKVNPIVAKGKGSPGVEPKTSTEVNNGCSKLCKERKCMFRNNLEDAQGKSGVWLPPTVQRADENKSFEQPVLDIEDLVALGKQHKICPFYHSRSHLKEAELILVPYNYLFDRDARETTLAEVDFSNAVLIFDEAHNLEEFASESSSFDLSSADIAGCISEVTRGVQLLEMNPETGDERCNKENLLRLKSMLINFESYLIEGISHRPGQKLSADAESSQPGEFIFDIFKEGLRVNGENKTLLIDLIQRLSDVVLEFKGTNTSGTPKLDHFVSCVKRAFGSGTYLLALARSKSYRVHISKVNRGGGFDTGRTISFWCFAPSLAMRELTFLNVRSILITSGTLSPLPSFSMELGLDFPVQLENDHVIKPDQIFVRVLGKGVSGKELSSKYGRRDDPEYIKELGDTLASLAGNIPAGVLVFFTSYGAMQTAIGRWGGPASGSNQSGGGRGASSFFAARRKKQAATPRYAFPQTNQHFAGPTNNTWQRLLSKKAIVIEPRSTSDLSDAIGEYKKFIALPKSNGAIMMGVCRGKISEGIDFTDDMARAVVVTGLPFAPYLDPKVKLKREFLDAARASAKSRPSTDGGFGSGDTKSLPRAPPKSLGGQEWYSQQAHRAVNQALGRVIRHRHDYGAVLLLDYRFAEPGNTNGLSKWLKPHLKNESCGSVSRGLVQFFRESKIKADNAKGKVVSAPAPPPPRRMQQQLSYQDEKEGLSVKVVQAQPQGQDNDYAYFSNDMVTNSFSSNEIKSKRIAATSVKVDRNDSSRGADEGLGLKSIYGTSNGHLPRSQIKSGPDSKPSSSFGSVHHSSSTGGVSRRQVRREAPKPRARSRTSDAAKLQAKRFFEQAQADLSAADLQRTQQAIVTLKGYGDAKQEQQYLKTAKELLVLLASKPSLIRSLFPLFPSRYRYRIEKMASPVVFDASQLRHICKEKLSDEDFASVKKFVVSVIFSDTSSDGTVDERTLLRESQVVLTCLVENDIDLQLFFDLIHVRHLRRMRSLALELKKTHAVASAKVRSAAFKGESCINSALFNRNEAKAPPALKPKLEDQEDRESQQNLSLALSQAMDANRQKKERVIELGKKVKSVTNPYQRQIAKRHHSQPNSSNGQPKRPKQFTSADNVDPLGCLSRINSEFVEPKSRQERIDIKIRKSLPKNMSCIVCHETPDEPLLATCGHYACFLCWKRWLARQNTCPSCQKTTYMKDLARMLVQKHGAPAPTLTQICNEESSEESEEELEIT